MLTAADDDLVNAKTPGLSPAWSFNIAYMSALNLCTAALAAVGYRAERDGKHYRTIGALPLVLGPGADELAGFLDHCRTMRHDATYEGVRSISQQEADELVSAVEELRSRLIVWLTDVHPNLA